MTCPRCKADLTRVIKDVLRKVDRSRFECPACEVPLVATAITTVTIAEDK
jgi:transposase-like protein